jgi:DNA mismatch repair protein MutL
MNLFLVVELGSELYLVDQHAAHERIIYDRLRRGGGGQELLFPVRLEIGDEEEKTLRQSADTLSRLGIQIEERDGGWELVTVPAVGNLEAGGVAALLMETLDRPSDFERELYASLSCRAAVMDGDVLTRETAESIIEGVIGLKNARCPHGRPVWVSWPLEELKRLVGRT